MEILYQYKCVGNITETTDAFGHSNKLVKDLKDSKWKKEDKKLKGSNFKWLTGSYNCSLWSLL